MIAEVTAEGKNFIGEAKIMDTPYGKIVKGLIDEGGQLGVSSRGMGSWLLKTAQLCRQRLLLSALATLCNFKAYRRPLKVSWKIKSGYGTMVSLRHKILKSIKSIFKSYKDLN